MTSREVGAAGHRLCCQLHPCATRGG